MQFQKGFFLVDKEIVPGEEEYVLYIQKKNF